MAATLSLCSVLLLLLAFVVVLGANMGPLMTNDLTQDMTLTCNMTSFLAAHRDDYENITDIKVIRRTAERPEKPTGEDEVLAAWTTAGRLSALASTHLLDSNRVVDITHFFFNRSNVEQNYFSLLYTDIGMYDYGRYFCSIGYLAKDHFTPETFNTTALPLLPAIEVSTWQDSGSSLTVSSGLKLTCSFTSDTDLLTSGQTLRIVHTALIGGEPEALASWQNGNFINSTTRAVVRRAVTIQNSQGVATTVILVVHRQRINCNDAGIYSCFVQAPGGSVALNDSTAIGSLSGCPRPRPPPCNSTGPTGAAVKPSADRLLFTMLVVAVMVVVFGGFKA